MSAEPRRSAKSVLSWLGAVSFVVAGAQAQSRNPYDLDSDGGPTWKTGEQRQIRRALAPAAAAMGGADVQPYGNGGVLVEKDYLERVSVVPRAGRASALRGTTVGAPWGPVTQFWSPGQTYVPEPGKPMAPPKPAEASWSWDYPRHRVLVASGGHGLSQQEILSRVATVARKVHEGMSAAGLTEGGAPAPPPDRTEPPAGNWRVRILVPPDLAPGSTLSPSAEIVDAQGRPPRRPVSVSWRINGRFTPSITWNGDPATIELQASVDGQAIVATAMVPRYAPPASGPTPADTPSGPVPGLGAVGPLPGPRSVLEGLAGVAIPAIVGILGGLASGLLSSASSSTGTPGPSSPPVPPRPGAIPPASPSSPAKPAPAVATLPRPPARSRAEIEAEMEAAQKKGQTSAWGLFTTTLGNIGLDVGKGVADATKAVKGAAQDASEAVKDVAADPSILKDTVRGMGQSVKDGFGGAAKAAQGAYDAANSAAHSAWSDPAKALQALAAGAKSALDKVAAVLTNPGALAQIVKDATGLTAIINSTDPSRTLGDRLGQYVMGAAQLVGTLQGAAAIASNIRKGATVVLGEVDVIPAPKKAHALTTVAPPRGGPSAPLGLAKDGVYAPAGVPPPTGGFAPGVEKHLQIVADQYGVEIHVRPTNPASVKLLAEGRALPKPEFVKNKTINDLDVLLGAPETGIGQAAHFKPALPPKGSMPDVDYQKLVDRHAKRLQEYNDEHASIVKGMAKGDIELDSNGLIRDPKTGKPFAGDNDLADIRGLKGEKLPAAVVAQVQKDLARPPFSAQHGAHMHWDYSGAKDFAKAQKIDKGVRAGHAMPTGQPGEGKVPLVTARPGEPLSSSWFTGAEVGHKAPPGGGGR